MSKQQYDLNTKTEEKRKKAREKRKRNKEINEMLGLGRIGSDAMKRG